MTNIQAITLLRKFANPYSTDDFKAATKLGRLAIGKQLPVEPVNGTWCKCGWNLMNEDTYCANCGQAIKWGASHE